MHSSRMRTGHSLTVWRGGGLRAGGGSPCWGCLHARGVSLPGGLPANGGSPCQGGGLLGGGVLPAGGSPWWGGSPPVNRMTDTCKNITLATTSLRPVIIKEISPSQIKYYPKVSPSTIFVRVQV